MSDIDFLLAHDWRFSERTEKWIAPWAIEDDLLLTTCQAMRAHEAFERLLVEIVEHGDGYV
jgi:hypothetical protein